MFTDTWNPVVTAEICFSSFTTTVVTVTGVATVIFDTTTVSNLSKVVEVELFNADKVNTVYRGHNATVTAGDGTAVTDGMDIIPNNYDYLKANAPIYGITTGASVKVKMCIYYRP